MKRKWWWGVLLVVWLAVGGVRAETVQLTQQFRQADIVDVIEAVAKLTGRNFIIDPRVKGKVTLIAPDPVPADSLYETLLAMLRVYGYGAVEGPTAIKIVPLSQIRDKASAHQAPPDGWVTAVIKTHWLDAAKLVPLIRPLVAREGLVAALPQSHALVITDTAANVDRIKHVIQRLDQPEAVFDVVPLRYADGEQLVQSLRGLLPKAVKLAYDPRGNQIILSGPKAPRLQVKALIAQLDVPVDQDGQVSVVYLRYAKAKDLAALLEKLSGSPFLKQVAKQAPSPNGQPKAVPVQTISSDKGPLVSVQADERMNALLISGPPALVKALKKVIRQLDIRRAQVLIEAVVVELSANKAAQLGVEWGAAGANGIGLLNLSGILPTLLGNAGNPAAQASAVQRGLNAAVGEQSGPDQGWLAFIRMLKTDSQANIISTPTLMTLDNEEAEIIVGREVPFQTGSYVNTGATATPTNPFTTIERRNVGLKLKLRPLINEGDEVQLDLALELSDVLPKGEAVDLQTSKREIKTSVIVGDGNVVVLGGLLTEKETEANSKVPGLGDVPLLGALFRTTDNQREKVNLMMFIRPVIVRDGAVSRAYSRKKYHELYRQQQNMLKQWDEGVLKGLRPRLKPLKQYEKGVKPAEEPRFTAPQKPDLEKNGGMPLQTLEELGVY